MNEFLQRRASKFWAGVSACVLLAVMPLPWSVGLLSFDHPKELWILAAALPVWLGWLAAGQARVSRGFLALLGLCAVWLVWGAALPGEASTGARFAALVGGGILLLGAALQPLAGDRGWRAPLVAAFLAGASATAVLALLQYSGLASGLFPVYAHYDQRLYSVFGNQDLLGGYMALAVVLAGSVLPYARFRTAQLLAWGAATLCFLALLLSGCRSAWAACAVGLGLLGWVERKRLTPGMGVQALGLLGVATLTTLAMAWEQTGQRFFSLFSTGDMGGGVRWWIARASFDMFQAHPLAGLGPGRFGVESPRYMAAVLHEQPGVVGVYNELWAEFPHSFLLEALAEGGLLGVAMLTLAVVIFARKLRDAAPLPGLTTLLCFALFNDAFRSAPHAVAFLVLLGGCMKKGESGAESGGLTLGRRSLVCLLLVQAVTLLGYMAGVFVPSSQLARAEDAHLRGEDAQALFESAATRPYTRADTLLGGAASALEQGQWEAAWTAAHAALPQRDTWLTHWILGAAARGMGREAEARKALRECLYRAPRNEAAFQALWEISSLTELEELEQHARIWGIVPTEP
jgi:O-antigen ligase